MSITITRPFLKWVGGKTQILQDVLRLFPTEIHNYHEPFVGGGSVLLGLLSKAREGVIRITGHVMAYDLNGNLISLYKNIQQNPDALILHTKRLAEDFYKCGEEHPPNRKPRSLEEAMASRENYYYWVRRHFNALPENERTSPSASAMMLFLNKTCFRGMYREGPHGFNVPYGNYKTPTILEEEHIRTVSHLIRDVVFSHKPFTEALVGAGTGDFVYLDPPYAPETGHSFVSYTADGFRLDNHNQLFAMCHAMREQGVNFLMSNADVKLVRDAFPYPTYTTRVLSCRRAIHAKKPQSVTNEVLITCSSGGEHL